MTDIEEKVHSLVVPHGQGRATPWQPLLDPLDVLTLSQAAAYLQLPESVVRAEAICQRLPGRAVAEDWRFVRADLLNWVRTCNVVSSVVCDETPEEQEAFWASILAHRDEIDRATKSGKYAEE